MVYGVIRFTACSNSIAVILDVLTRLHGLWGSMVHVVIWSTVYYDLRGDLVHMIMWFMGYYY